MHDLDRLKQLLKYDSETGDFVWLVARGKARKGIVAGNERERVNRIRLDGKTYAAHRLAWLFVYGEWPAGCIDHINGNARDNRIANLRLASHSENMRNRKKHKNNKSGFKGVTFEPGRTRPWCARIYVGGRLRRLGSFRCPTAASLAYGCAAKRYFGEFSRLE